MSLLGQILVSIITIIPLTLLLAITQAAGHVTLLFVLVLQSIASIVVFFVLFLKFGMKINAERMIRWFISSFIIIVASVFEWEFFSQFISLFVVYCVVNIYQEVANQGLIVFLDRIIYNGRGQVKL